MWVLGSCSRALPGCFLPCWSWMLTPWSQEPQIKCCLLEAALVMVFCPRNWKETKAVSILCICHVLAFFLRGNNVTAVLLSHISKTPSKTGTVRTTAESCFFPSSLFEMGKYFPETFQMSHGHIWTNRIYWLCHTIWYWASPITELLYNVGA